MASCRRDEQQLSNTTLNRWPYSNDVFEIGLLEEIHEPRRGRKDKEEKKAEETRKRKSGRRRSELERYCPVTGDH